MSRTNTTYNRSESFLDWDLDNDSVEREEQAKLIRDRRRLVIISVISIFLLTSVVMVMSVVYVEMNKGVLGLKVQTICVGVPVTACCAGGDVFRE